MLRAVDHAAMICRGMRSYASAARVSSVTLIMLPRHGYAQR